MKSLPHRHNKPLRSPSPPYSFYQLPDERSALPAPNHPAPQQPISSRPTNEADQSAKRKKNRGSQDTNDQSHCGSSCACYRELHDVEMKASRKHEELEKVVKGVKGVKGTDAKGLQGVVVALQVRVAALEEEARRGVMEKLKKRLGM